MLLLDIVLSIGPIAILDLLLHVDPFTIFDDGLLDADFWYQGLIRQIFLLDLIFYLMQAVVTHIFLSMSDLAEKFISFLSFI